MHQGSANSINPILEALTLGFGGIQALNEVSFELAPGPITSVIEPNDAEIETMYAGGSANA